MNELLDGVYLGDIQDAKMYGDTVDIVISVARNYTEYTDYHVPLKDSNSIDSSNFNDAVDTVQNTLTTDDTVLVHCIVGSSRGPTVLATAIAAENGTSFDEELQSMKGQRGVVNLLPEVASEGRRYIDEVSIQ